MSMLKKNFCDFIAVFSFDQFNVLIIFDSTCNTDKQDTKKNSRDSRPNVKINFPKTRLNDSSPKNNNSVINHPHVIPKNNLKSSF